MPDDRISRVNNHVSRLNRYLPFSAAHEQIYEEYQTGDDGLDLLTVALDYSRRAVASGARCIVLTGDAGHGKTHSMPATQSSATGSACSWLTGSAER